MNIPLYQVDAFTLQHFAGNPAAVMPLDSWLSDDVLQSLAAENNLSETAFFVPEGAEGSYQLRWFTPTSEVQLCGHATLASAFVLFECLGFAGKKLRFQTLSGELEVERCDSIIMMTLPSYPPQACDPPVLAAEAFAGAEGDWYIGPNYLLLLENETAVRNAAPDMALLSQLKDRCVIVSAPGDAPGTDFVSRFFAPNYGIPEDPVTGSAHCMLTPFWAKRLQKQKLRARQISARGGDLECELVADQVKLGGQAVLYLQGEVII